ncbi:hypothetical protein Hanom_Chr14g01266661 [Helianthus anomalus]
MRKLNKSEKVVVMVQVVLVMMVEARVLTPRRSLGEYPLGLLCCCQGGGTRGAPIFVHGGDVVLLLSVCSWICCKSTWRLVTGDTCCPFCRKEHLRCHIDVF